MIDYEKLKQAYELAKKLPFSWYSLSASQGAGACTNYYVLSFESWSSKSHQYEFTHDEVDHLIEKLQELIIPKPEPKYKVGDEVFITWHGYIEEARIVDRTSQDRYQVSLNDGGQLSRIEDEIFPTRQELIEHQINYWQSLHPDNQLKMNNGGIGYAPPFEGEIHSFRDKAL